MEPDVYARIGEDGFERLVASFYRRVRTDDLLAPLYPEEDWAGAEERLRDFLVGRFGGPPRYVERRGHPRLRMRHAPFPIGVAERNRWFQLMEASLLEAELPEEESQFLRGFFSEVATFLVNRPT
ncbi:MAG: globin [Planctomycetota bacterium]